jgi:hypothetical protein
METFFAEMGSVVAGRWKERNFSLGAFPGIAAGALGERAPAEHVDVGGVVRDFLLNDEQAFQTGSGFGQPELIVYDHPRFYIQVLFWLEGATDIHQHEFSGAFHVMQGSSIHARFAFDGGRDVSAHMRVGTLRLTGIDLLDTGSTVPIVSGREHIHSLFHLDTPSISVVVRTHNDPGTGPQFTYLPPHIAVDPVQNDALTTRRKQLLDVLEKAGDPAYGPLVMEMLAELDFERGFFILQNGMAALQGLGEWDVALRVFRKTHGALATGVGATLDEIVRRDRVVAMRNGVTEPEHRFFLALLLNVPDRRNILRLVKERFGGNPAATISRWAGELMDGSGVATWLLDAEFPEELGVPYEEQAGMMLGALGYYLAGAMGKCKVPAGPLKGLRGALGKSSLRALLG